MKLANKKQSTKVILLDMDGVMCDFVTAVLRLNNTDPKILEKFKGDYEITKHLKMTPTDFWKRIEEEEDFWHYLEKTSEADDLMNHLEQQTDPKNIYFCSSPSQDPYSHFGKAFWIKTHYPRYINRLILTNHKHFMAGKDRILIDDSDSNISKFKEHGGLTVLVPRKWNSKHTVHSHEVLEHTLADLRRVL
jgi:5'(3')-deoxyribonucleotidase